MNLKLFAPLLAGTLALAGPAPAERIADLSTGYSNVQGANGWNYMKMNWIPGLYSTALMYPMYYISDHGGLWSSSEYGVSTPTIQSGGRMDLSNSTAGVLRWVSDRDTTARIEGAWHHPDYIGATDITVYIYVDGIQQYMLKSPHGYGYRNPFDITMDLHKGSVVDFVGSAGRMVAYFDVLTIDSVPEPTNLIALITGLAGIGGVAIRRRK